MFRNEYNELFIATNIVDIVKGIIVLGVWW